MQSRSPLSQRTKSGVAFSESEGEEIIDSHSIGSLHMNEMKALRNKFTKTCQICHSRKPPRVHHCSQCNRCVLCMDHHCVWIGNCVGLRNMKPFLLFLGYTFLACAYSFTLCTTEIIRCYGIKDCYTGIPNDGSNRSNIHLVNTILTCFGLLFTLCMLFLTFAVLVSQLQRIRNSSNPIEDRQIQQLICLLTIEQRILERVSVSISDHGSFLFSQDTPLQPNQGSNLAQYMSGGADNKFSLSWLFPTTPKAHDNVILEEYLSLAYLMGIEMVHEQL